MTKYFMVDLGIRKLIDYDNDSPILPPPPLQFCSG